MKKFISILFLCFTFALITVNVRAQEAFTINHFDVELDVRENGEIHVSQTLKVTFDEPRHGLYFDLPEVYDMNWNIDGNNVDKRYRFPVTNISVGNDMKYRVENQSKGKRIVIGDEDIFVEGTQIYQIKYVMETKDLGLGGRQMLYQNLISPAWDTTIESASFEIKMPKIFDLGAISFSIGQYGSSGTQEIPGFKYETNGTTILANLETPLQNYEGVTIQLALPDHYFTYPQSFDWSMVIVMASLASAIGAVVLFFLYGKDGLVIKSIQFRAPDNLDCAAMSYILDSRVSQRDVIALLIEWANKEYLMIEEVDQKTLHLIKLREMGQEAKKYERKLFHALFGNREDVYTDNLDTKFYQNIDVAIHAVTKYYSTKENRVFYKSSSIFQIIGLIVSAFPMFVGAFYTIYKALYEMEWGVLGGIAYLVFATICIGLLYYTVSSRYSIKRVKYIGLLVCSFVLLGAMILIYHAIFIFMHGKALILYSTLLSSLILTWTTLYMDKRTAKGNVWLGEILGLKDFIETAEKERLEELVNEDPQYFYHVLPYAYVLGISDVWSKKFSDIVMENAKWYQSEEALPVYLFMPRYYRCMNNLHTQLYHIPDMEVAKGGGGISSGGGGFSGGGFGGGGGGSW